MMQLTFYKLATGWYWQVTKEVGPAIFVEARSGHAFVSEDAAKQGYKEFRTWACGGTSTSPTT